MTERARRAVDGWFAPSNPGPRRAQVVRCVLVGGLLLVAAWGHGARLLDAGRLHDHTQRITRGTGMLPAAGAHLRRRGTTPWVSQRIEVARSTAERVEIAISVPAGVAPDEVSVRAWSREALVDVRRSPTGDPRVVVRRLGAAAPVHLLIARPTTPGERPSTAAAARRPELARDTEPFSARAREAHATALRLDHVRSAGWWLVPLLLATGVGLPLLALAGLRRRWTMFDVPPPLRDAPTGPPGTGSALRAGLATRGALPLDPADAFAAHVLDLVAAGSIDARRVVDRELGAGTMLRVGASADDLADLDLRARELLARHALPESSSVLLPDRAQPTASSAEADRWRRAVAHAQASSGLLDTPAIRPWHVAGQAASVLMVVVVVLAVREPDPGVAAWLWVWLATLAALAYTVRQVELELRSWRRVAPTARVARVRWLHWRNVLAAATPATADRRSVPYALAAAVEAGMLGDDAAPDARGLAAITTATVAGLRGYVDGTWVDAR